MDQEKKKQPSCQEIKKWLNEVYIPWYNSQQPQPQEDSGGNPGGPPPPPPGGGPK